jgi:YVTN family beta-propeller protein
MAIKIQLRRGLEAEWISSNPILEVGELAFSKDKNSLKIGDGVSVWSTLHYICLGSILGSIVDGSHIKIKFPSYIVNLAITPDGATAYVLSNDDSSVIPMDILTGVIGSAISVGSNPYYLAITPDGATVYVANSGDGTVTPIDILTGIAGSSISVASDLGGIAITPDGATAFVASASASSLYKLVRIPFYSL